MWYNGGMDSIVHYENERIVGTTNFPHGLLNSLIVLSVRDIEGVLKLENRKHHFRAIFNKGVRQGVLVGFDFDGVTVEVQIWTKFGVSAADVAARVQEAVINTVTGLVEDKIKAVNVIIHGVVNEQKKVA